LSLNNKQCRNEENSNLHDCALVFCIVRGLLNANKVFQSILNKTKCYAFPFFEMQLALLLDYFGRVSRKSPKSTGALLLLSLSSKNLQL
jgi:hypothetical protein